MVDVSVIIVNYNSIKLIIDSIESIVKQTNLVTYEIIVVDNNSEKGLIQILEPKFGNLVSCIQLEENVGFGRANNEGAKIAKGRNLLFLNPDTILTNDAISIMSNYLDCNKDIGACGGNLYNSEDMPTRSFRRCLPSLSWLMGSLCLFSFYETILYGKNKCFNTTDKILDVSYVVGADLMMPATLFKELTGFDSRFFMYYEEVELCARVTDRGYRIVNIPSAKIKHLEGKSSNNIVKKAQLHYDSMQCFYRIRYSKIYNWFVDIILFILSIQRLSISFLLCNHSKITYWKQFLSLQFAKKYI